MQTVMTDPCYLLLVAPLVLPCLLQVYQIAWGRPGDGEAACLCEEAAAGDARNCPAGQVRGDEEGLPGLVDRFDQGRGVLILRVLRRYNQVVTEQRHMVAWPDPARQASLPHLLSSVNGH